MGDLAIGLDAITRAGDLGPVPLLQQRRQGRPVVAVFRKTSDREIVFDVRGRVPLQPRILNAAGEVLSGIVVEPFRDQLYSLEPNERPNCFMVRVPAGVVPGEYLLDAGAGGGAWEITWSDAEKLVLYAPGGLSCDGGPACYFKVPQETASFEVYGLAETPLYRPAGSRVTADAPPGGWQRVDAQGGNEFWRFKPQRNNAHFELRGMPAILVCDTNRWFMPDLDRIDFAAAGVRRDYESQEKAILWDDPAATYVTGVTPGGKGLLLNKRRTLKLDTDPSMLTRAGTLELWLRPDWSSVYGAKHCTVLSHMSDSWMVVLNYYDRANALFRITPNGRDRVDLYVGVTLERGLWYHLAWQWETDQAGKCKLEFFINGVLHGDANRMVVHSDDPQNLATTSPTSLLFGHHRGRPAAWGGINGVVANLRFSNCRRYRENFKPVPHFEPDSNTTALFTFADSLEAVSGNGCQIKSELLQ